MGLGKEAWLIIADCGWNSLSGPRDKEGWLVTRAEGHYCCCSSFMLREGLNWALFSP